MSRKANPRPVRALLRLIGATIAGVTLMASAAAPTAAASARQDDTFTQVSGSPNPTDTGTPFTVSALECDRTRNVQATGTMVFTDVTTNVAIGSVALGTSPYVNCGGASIADSEALAAGKDKVKAHYVPGGANPVTPSPAAKYVEVVKQPTFTDVSWTSGASIPDPHIEGASVGVGTKVYAISGATEDCTDTGAGPLTSAVDAYNTSTNTFATKAPIPNAREADPAAVAVSTNIYVIGGTNGCGGTTVAPVDVYATATNTWTTLPASSDLPASLTGAYHCAAVSGGQIYYFEQNGIGVLDTNVSPPTWSVLPANPLLDPSEFCDAGVVGKVIVITGPGDGSADANSQRVLVFNPATSSITLSTGTTFPAAEHAMVTLKGEGVLAGGDFNNTDVDLILPGLQVVRAATSLPQTRDDTGQGAAIGGKVYIVGGESTSTATPPVLIGTPT